LIILRNKIKIIFKGSIYRISGDEFVCLYKGNKIDLLLITFNENIVNSFEMGILFLVLVSVMQNFLKMQIHWKNWLQKRTVPCIKKKSKSKKFSEPLQWN